MKQALVIISALALVGCSAQKQLMGGGYVFRPTNLFGNATESVSRGFWDKPASLTGEHVIRVDTARQEAKYYIGGQQVGYTTISSGRAGHGTPRGVYTVLSKDIDHVSSTYGSVVDSAGKVLVENYTRGGPMPKGGIYKGAPMNYALQLTSGGIWMHEGYVTSAPESHGCIRLPREMAKIFFENTPIGTKVIVM